MTVRGDFKEPARPRPDLVIGRDELFAGAREQLSGGGSVLVHGPAGIGKSTVLRALAAESAESAHTVLRCWATESESHLPFLALADLLGLVVDEVSDRLPAPSARHWNPRSPAVANQLCKGTASPCGSRSSPCSAPWPPRVPS